jgi:Fe-S cluster biogenesis protein NfuA
MTQPREIKITAEPVSAAVCKFAVDRPLVPDRSWHFANREQAEGSPLAERLFAIEGVTALLVSHDQVNVTKGNMLDWRVVGKLVGAAIREHVSSGQPALRRDLWDTLPPEEEIREKVQAIIDEEINPQVAGHGGFISLLDVKGNVVYIRMGGGCQGCGMADVTLKQGIEKAIRAAIPEVGDILDATDHASGRNPYYAPSKK